MVADTSLRNQFCIKKEKRYTVLNMCAGKKILNNAVFEPHLCKNLPSKSRI